MRIVAGRLRGRPIQAPAGTDVRPTADRVRESVFNILVHAPFGGEARLHGAQVLDAFAGTGSMGLEALSRGASHAHFIEQNPAVLEQLQRNVTALGQTASATCWRGDATVPQRAPAPCGLLFLDPPYHSDLAAQALAALAGAGWAKDGALAVLELDRKASFVPPVFWTVEDDRPCGRARVVFLQRHR